MPGRILAIFDTPGEALRAKELLRREGFASDAITLMSSEPIQIEESDDNREPKGFIGLFAVAGAVLGASSALLLTVLASKRMGLVVGGMPVVAPWPFGIIVFELTALGAILAAFARMIFESGLAKPRALSHYDSSIAEGKIVLAVEYENDPGRNAIEKVFAATGAQARQQ